MDKLITATAPGIAGNMAFALHAPWWLHRFDDDVHQSDATRAAAADKGRGKGAGVDHGDHVNLIREGVEGGSVWADFGSGQGAFTLALADLLGPGAIIHSIDRDGGALRAQAAAMAKRFPGVTVRYHEADFGRLEEAGRNSESGAAALADVDALDGIVMANSLHFSADHVAVLRPIVRRLRIGGSFLLVEYDADRGNPWVPHPLSFATWRRIAPPAGLTEPRLIGRVASHFLGAIYAAHARRVA